MKDKETALIPKGGFVYEYHKPEVDFDNGGTRDVLLTLECKYRGEIKVLSVYVYAWSTHVTMAKEFYDDIVGEIQDEMDKIKIPDEDKYLDGYKDAL